MNNLKEVRRPDKEKILSYADAIMAIDGPEIKSLEAKIIMADFYLPLAIAIKALRDGAEAL